MWLKNLSFCTCPGCSAFVVMKCVRGRSVKFGGEGHCEVTQDMQCKRCSFSLNFRCRPMCAWQYYMFHFAHIRYQFMYVKSMEPFLTLFLSIAIMFSIYLHLSPRFRFFMKFGCVGVLIMPCRCMVFKTLNWKKKLWRHHFGTLW